MENNWEKGVPRILLMANLILLSKVPIQDFATQGGPFSEKSKGVIKKEVDYT